MNGLNICSLFYCDTFYAVVVDGILTKVIIFPCLLLWLNIIKFEDYCVHIDYWLAVSVSLCWRHVIAFVHRTKVWKLTINLVCTKFYTYSVGVAFFHNCVGITTVDNSNSVACTHLYWWLLKTAGRHNRCVLHHHLFQGGYHVLLL